MGRAPCCDKNSVKKGPWSPEEDAKLKDYIDNYGTGGNWISLPHKIGLSRCGKSCRLRWLNYLRPNLKHGGFSEEEDNIICSLYISIGSRWSIIAAQLPGRTDNDIKNYWNTRLKKKLLGRKKQQSNINNRLLPALFTSHSANDMRNGPQQALSSSAMDRLQLHLQLQTLQADSLPFYNSPALWPKLHPLQEKTIQQNLHLMNNQENDSSFMPNYVAPSPQNNCGFYQPQQDVSAYTEMMMSNESGENGDLQSKLDIVGSGFLDPKTGQDDYGCLLNTSSNKMAELVSQQFDDFDCFKLKVESSKDNSNSFISWWPSSEFDSKSTSSNSWDSSSAGLHSEDQMFEDFVFGL